MELWKSDGTAAGTDIIGTDGQAPNLGLGSFSLTAVDNTLYFVANDPISGLELWKTDGTFANTAVVRNISSGAADSLPTCPCQLQWYSRFCRFRWYQSRGVVQ